MREQEVVSSRLDPNNASGQSDGFFGDGFRLTGGRVVAGEALYIDGQINPAQLEPFGGLQGFDRLLFNYPYSQGGVIDSALESFAGPHDWLGSWWSYDPATGDNNYLNSPFGSVLARVLGNGVAKFMDSAMGGVDLPLAAPFAIASEFATHPTSTLQFSAHN
jgi:filamentous hemagglutinin